MKCKLLISHIGCVFMVHPSDLKFASCFPRYFNETNKNLNKKRTVLLKSGVPLPYYLVQIRGAQSSV